MPRTPRILIVTPAHNEESNVHELHESLGTQTFRDFDWVVVNDGSTDSTATELDSLVEWPLPAVMERTNDGGLIGGSAYTAWRYGIDNTPDAHSAYTHIMKLDADVRLPSSYLQTVLDASGENTGIVGGVIGTNRMREQSYHVPGPVKLYTVAAYRAISDLPSAIGFDVMDEVAVREQGFATLVVPEAKFFLARAIGASEGGVHGRYRNGRVCRWTGYDFGYFLLHAVRYLGRAPFVVGSVAMIWGYATAGTGPYSAELRKEHAASQRRKLGEASRNPIRWVNRTYRY